MEGNINILYIMTERLYEHSCSSTMDIHKEDSIVNIFLPSKILK